MRIWLLALVGCGSTPDVPLDSGLPSTTTPLPTTEPPPLGTWDEDQPVGLVSLEPNTSFYGPITVWWQQRVPFAVRIEFRHDGGAWQSTPVRQGVSGLNRQSIIGVPPGATAEVRIVGASSVAFTVDADAPITTPALPDSFPAAHVQVDDPDGWGPSGRYYLTSINENPSNCSWCTGRYWTFIADRQGTVYWATRSPDNRQVLYPQISTASGDHVLWDEVVWDLQSEGSLIHRTWLDREIEVVAAPGHHHAFLELADGTLVWGDKRTNMGEALVEKRPGSEALRTVWTCQDDWIEGGCRSNSLTYDPAVDRYWYSFYTQRAIVEIDRTTGATQWSSQFDNGPSGPTVYDFDPPESQFDWQHGVRHLGDDHLLVSTDRDVDEHGNVHTVVAEYAIDRDAGVLREVWHYDPGEDARFNGETLRLANGNTLHAMGARSIAYEVDPAGTVVWQVEYTDGKMLNRIEPLDDLWGLLAPPPYDPRVDPDPSVGRPGPTNAP